MLSLQRQGRIGFYGTATGQEAAITGSAYALRDTDWVFPALREIGVSLWRGTTLKEIVCQLIGNSGDVLIGRQMPCHFSDRKVNIVAWSSVIGTQLAARDGRGVGGEAPKHDDRVRRLHRRRRARSSGDFHAAANFAGVFKLPVVFFCQNNQWAISVPLVAQTASESIAIKAVAYGFPGVRVDGNDLLAVIAAMREAVERARRGEGPTLIEAVTFRMGGHSSSDDPTRYRDADAGRRVGAARSRSRACARYLRARGLLTRRDDEARWTAGDQRRDLGAAIQRGRGAAAAADRDACSPTSTARCRRTSRSRCATRWRWAKARSSRARSRSSARGAER